MALAALVPSRQLLRLLVVCLALAALAALAALDPQVEAHGLALAAQDQAPAVHARVCPHLSLTPGLVCSSLACLQPPEHQEMCIELVHRCRLACMQGSPQGGGHELLPSAASVICLSISSCCHESAAVHSLAYCLSCLLLTIALGQSAPFSTRLSPLSLPFATQLPFWWFIDTCLTATLLHFCPEFPVHLVCLRPNWLTIPCQSVLDHARVWSAVVAGYSSAVNSSSSACTVLICSLPGLPVHIMAPVSHHSLGWEHSTVHV